MAEWKVLPEESGTKLQAYLKMKLEGISARQIKKWIEENLCLVNGRTERFASAVLGRGDVVALAIEEPRKAVVRAVFDPSRILYEDSGILIYDKPAGVVSDSREWLAARPGFALAHRLDRDTTGVLMFGKSGSSLEALEALFRERAIEKTYLAVVDGAPQQNGVIENYLGKLKVYHGQTLWGEVAREQGSYAKTVWRCEKRGKTASVVVCKPETGRTHQIRVHMSGIGHPILGDHQYGRTFRSSYRPGRCLLHALSVSFVHPVTAKAVHIEAPVPEDILKGIKEAVER